MTDRKRTAILISGRGSNMAALIDAARDRSYPAEIVCVLSNREGARGLELAAAAGIEARAFAGDQAADRDALDSAIDAALGNQGVELVCLAGYMRLLTPAFVEKWAGRLINIHPSLLPLFRGLDSHRRCIEAGMRVHGCTVHFVTAEMDAGPIIAQAAVPVLPADDAEALAARVLAAEHRLYPLALQLVAEGRARVTRDGRVDLDLPAGAASVDTLFSPSPDSLSDGADLENLARFTP